MQLKFRELTLADKALYDSFAGRTENTKYSFALSFAWRDTYGLRFAETPYGLAFISGYTKPDCYLVSPLLKSCKADASELFLALERYIIEKRGSYLMKLVCREMTDKLERDLPGRYRFTLDRDNSEYVYSTQSLAELKGKKLHSKRNFINAFEREYDYSFAVYDDSYYDQCMAVQQQWAEGKGVSQEVEETRAIACALKYHRELELRIGMIITGGKVIAFSAAEKHTKTGSAVLFEKGLVSYPGIFQLINREMARNLLADTPYVNRGEDMGIEGMRRAKQSYQPEFLIDKFDCELKG